MVNSVPSDMPPTITQPICWRLSEPAPCANASGNRTQHHRAGGHENRPQAL
jgi:hypothetical protein